MGHSCPECSVACYCGGDVDDIIFNDTPEQDRCAHCPEDDGFEPDDLPPQCDCDRSDYQHNYGVGCPGYDMPTTPAAPPPTKEA